MPEDGPGTPIEVVVHGEAICLALPGQPTADALAEALDAGIVLVVCRNSMRSQHLRRTSSMAPFSPRPGSDTSSPGRQKAGHTCARKDRCAPKGACPP